MKKIYGLIVLTLCFTSFSLANIRPPQTPEPKGKTIDVRMSISLDPNAKETKLIVPKKQLKELRAELERLDNESNSTETTAEIVNDAGGNTSRTQTIVGGLFLSMAFVFGGFLFVRSRNNPDQRRGKKMIVGAVMLLTLGSATATLVFANAGPPSVLRSISSDLFNKEAFKYWGSASGTVKVQVSDSSNYVELVVPLKETKEAESK